MVRTLGAIALIATAASCSGSDAVVGDLSTPAADGTNGRDAGPEPDLDRATDGQPHEAAADQGGTADAPAGDGAADARPGDGTTDAASDSWVPPDGAAIQFDGTLLPPLACARPTSGTLPDPQAGVWSREVVESGLELVNQFGAPSQWGSGTSIAVTSTGEIHVGYYTNEFICSTAGALRHAVRSGTTWTRDTPSCRESGYWSRMRVDATDRVHAVYAAGLASGRQMARYARHDGGGWDYPSEPVAGGYMRSGAVALALGCDQRPIVFVDGAIEVETSAGSLEFVEAGAIFDEAMRAHIERDSAGGLHLAADVPVPTAPSTWTYMTRYAHWNGATWSVEDPTDGALGTTVGLAIDGSGRAHVVYQTRGPSSANQSLVHAVRGANGWTRDTVLTGYLSGSAGFAIDGADELVVLQGHKLARRAGAAGSWTVSTVSQLIGAAYLSLVIDGAGTLHVAFYDIGTPSGLYHDYPATAYHAALASP